MIFCNHNRSILILELVRSDINYKAMSIKPRMGMAFLLATHVVKVAVAILLKILGKKEARITTSTIGVILKSDERERFRIALYNCGTKGSGQLCHFVYISIDHVRGEISINKDYPIDVDRLLSICHSSLS